MVEQGVNSEVYIKVLLDPMTNPLGINPSKGNQENTRGKEKFFDLGGNQTHNLWIRSTVTLPTDLQSQTEKVGDDSGGVKRSDPPLNERRLKITWPTLYKTTFLAA